MATPSTDIVGVPAAAKVLGVSQQAVRSHLRAGTLKASKAQGKYGPTWTFHPAVLAAFALEHYGRVVAESALAPQTPAQVPPPPADALPEDVRDLYERIVALTAEATRFKAIAEVSESAEADYKAQLAALTQERDAAQAELDRLRARGFWSRVFGGKA